MTGFGRKAMLVMVKISFAFLSIVVAAGLSGCGEDANSPSMGAVPPKPNMNMAKNLPPEIQGQMKNAPAGMASQASEMGEKAKNLHPSKG